MICFVFEHEWKLTRFKFFRPLFLDKTTYVENELKYVESNLDVVNFKEAQQIFTFLGVIFALSK